MEVTEEILVVVAAAARQNLTYLQRLQMEEMGGMVLEGEGAAPV